MPVIKAKKVPKKKVDPEDLLARFCYYFPQYTFHEARNLPHKRIAQMMHVAEKEYARKMHDLTNIVASPHTKKGSGVKKLLKHFQAIIKS